jgi:RimJ/RimL family protein N-acetyltransferase
VEPVEINLGLYYLRALRADDRIDDRQAIVEGFTDPDTKLWAPGWDVGDLAAAGRYVALRAEEWAKDVRYSWAVADPTTGELLGEVGLKELDLVAGTAEAAVWTHPAGRNRGVAARALGAAVRFGFGAVGLECVRYKHFESNKAAARVADKCGFSQLERIWQATLGDGSEDRLLVRIANRD